MNQVKVADIVQQLHALGCGGMAGIISDFAQIKGKQVKLEAENQRLRERLRESTELLRECLPLGEYYPEATEEINNQIAANEAALKPQE